MAYATPNILYKYRPINRFLPSLICEGAIYLSAVKQFNDPFDCRLCVTSECTPRDFKAWLNHPANRHTLEHLKRENAGLSEKAFYRHLHLNKEKFVTEGYANSVFQQIDRIGIFCVSETCDNLLMWSHYGDQHKGVCVEIDTQVDQSIAKGFLKVNYSEDTPVFYAFHSDPVQHSVDSLGTKSKDWEYEREWRMYKINGAYTFHHCKKQVIRGLIFGAKVETLAINNVLSMIRKARMNIRVRRAKIIDGAYKLCFVDV